jgi:NAD(P)-dependent dehydrogenase (short-subunit alcohol dehydrogenase family)
MSTSNVAVIAGGTGSVGRRLLPLLLERDFNVATTYLLPEEATGLENELDFDEDRLILRRVDVTDPQAADAFVREASDAFGEINVMASLVGGWTGGRDVVETEDVQLDRMIDLNLRSAWNMTRSAIPLMSDDWGRIVLMGSKHAAETPTGQAAYNVAKAGVLALAKSVATELLDTATTCNALLPSVINTEATRRLFPTPTT